MDVRCMYGACMVHVWCMYGAYPRFENNFSAMYGACMVHSWPRLVQRRTTIHPFQPDQRLWSNPIRKQHSWIIRYYKLRYYVFEKEYFIGQQGRSFQFIIGSILLLLLCCCTVRDCRVCCGCCCCIVPYDITGAVVVVVAASCTVQNHRC